MTTINVTLKITIKRVRMADIKNALNKLKDKILRRNHNNKDAEEGSQK